MKIIAISMVRDEADVIAQWVAHLVNEGFDRIIVADNLSTDGTEHALEVIEDIGWRFGSFPLVVLSDPDPAYRQGEKMSALGAAQCQPGDWCVPIDADELWFSLDGQPLADTLRNLDADVAVARPFVHVPHESDDETDENPFTRIRHRQLHVEPQPKVAFRWIPGAVIDMGNHNVFGAGDRRVENLIGARHFQYRSLEQTKRKVRQGSAAADAAGLHRGYATHWRNMAGMTDAELEVWWKEYCAQETVLDPAPWNGL